MPRAKPIDTPIDANVNWDDDKSPDLLDNEQYCSKAHLLDYY